MIRDPVSGGLRPEQVLWHGLETGPREGGAGSGAYLGLVSFDRVRGNAVISPKGMSTKIGNVGLVGRVVHRIGPGDVTGRLKPGETFAERS